MSRVSLFAIAASLALPAAPAMASSVSTAWAELPGNDQEECLEIGSEVIRKVGFRASISRDRQTVFGWRGEAALTIRCISGRGIAVVFAWVTDRNNDSGRLVDAVTAAYRDRRMPRGNLGGGGQWGNGGQGGIIKR